MANDPAGVQKRARRPWPLWAYFVAIAVLVVTVGGVAAGFVYERSRDDARRSALADASYAAQKAADQLASGVQIWNRATIPALKDPGLAGYFAHPNPTCHFGYAALGAFETGVIANIRRDGSVACWSAGPVPEGRPYAGESWIARRATVAPYLDPTNRHEVAVLSYPFRRIGVLVVLLDLKPIGPKLSAEFGSGVHKLEFLVVNGDSVVTRSLDPARWTGKRLDRTRLDSGRDVDGTARWYATAPVAHTSWKVYVGADRAAALDAAAGLRSSQLGILGGGVAAVLLALAFVYRRVARPIGSLSRAVRSSSGEALPRGGPAEVSMLAENVDGFRSTIKQTEENYRRLFDGSPLAMWVYDVDGFRILEANDAALAVYGYSREEFVGLSAKAIVAPEGHGHLEERAASGEPSVGLVDVEHVRKGGVPFAARLTAHATVFAGRPARVVAVEDVSEQERLEARLRQAQKMEAVGQLAAGVAHDFNNVLTVIGGANALVLEQLRGRDDELSRERLHQIELATQQAAELTQQLLAFGRQQVLRPEPTDLSAVLADTLVLVRRLLGDQVEIVTELEPETAAIVIDRSQLQQVILNLCVNARDAMPNGGTLVIRTANTELDETYASKRPDVTPGAYVLVEITDTGVGMDSETASRIFEPFFTTKEMGNGLGLATVHGIVKQSGGHISLYSEPGIGTTFSVYLPPAAAPARPPVEAAEAGPLEGDETILVVEDSDLLRPLVVEMLESYGYTALAAANGVEALELADGHDGPIDVLLTDVVMPQMNGRELADLLTAYRPAIHVLFTSGYPADTVIRQGIAQGRFVYIQKPYLAHELVRAIRGALDTRATV